MDPDDVQQSQADHHDHHAAQKPHGRHRSTPSGGEPMMVKLRTESIDEEEEEGRAAGDEQYGHDSTEAAAAAASRASSALAASGAAFLRIEVRKVSNSPFLSCAQDASVPFLQGSVSLGCRGSLIRRLFSPEGKIVWCGVTS